MINVVIFACSFVFVISKRDSAPANISCRSLAIVKCTSALSVAIKLRVFAVGDGFACLIAVVFCRGRFVNNKHFYTTGDIDCCVDFVEQSDFKSLKSTLFRRFAPRFRHALFTFLGGGECARVHPQYLSLAVIHFC